MFRARSEAVSRTSRTIFGQGTCVCSTCLQCVAGHSLLMIRRAAACGCVCWQGGCQGSSPRVAGASYAAHCADAVRGDALLATLCCVLGSRLGPLLVQSRVCQRCSHPRLLAIPVVYTRSTTRGRSLCMHHLCTACGALLLFRVALLVFMPSSACRSRHFASRLRLCTPSVRALRRSSAGTRRSTRTMWRGQTAGTCSMSTWVLGGWDLGL